MALDLTGGRAGLNALAEAMRRWIAHVLGVEVEIEPLTELHDAPLTWYVGLDADATRSAICCGTAQTSMRPPWRGVVGLFLLNFAIRRSCSTRSRASRSI